MGSWITRQRNIIDFALSSLFRKKGKNIALVIMYTIIVFLLASVMFFTHALRTEASLVLRGAPEVVVQRMIAGRQDLIPLSYRNKISKIAGVSSVQGRLWGYYYDSSVHANYTLLVPGENAPAGGTVVIGQGIARMMAAAPGDILTLKGYDGQFHYLSVSSISSSDSELISSDLMVLGEKDFRRLFRVPEGEFTDLVVNVRNSQEVPTVAEKITRALPDSRPISRQEILRTYDAIFDWRSGVVLIMLSTAVLSFVIFAWDKASGLSAEEKKEIGILKAVGWETSEVLLMKGWEGAIISLSSFLIGIILAYLHVFFTPAALFEPVLKGWSTLYPKFTLVPFISLYQVVILFLLSVVPYTVATIIPSWRAATIDPDSIMRSSL
jgi:ABC-type lipoprotein release transport system permease subunit